MIYGRIRPDGRPPRDLAPLPGGRAGPAPGRAGSGGGPAEAVRGGAALGWLPEGAPGLDRKGGLWQDDEGVAVAQGVLTNSEGLRRQLADAGCPVPTDATLPALILAAVRAFGEGAAARLEGTVAWAAWPGRGGPARVCRDRLGVEPLFAAEQGGELIFGSRARGVADAGPGRALDGDALREYLLLGYLAGLQTLFSGVRRLAGGELLEVAGAGVRSRRWWRPGPAGDRPASREEAVERLRELMPAAVTDLAAGAGRLGVFLSGGLDSSAVTALLSRQPGSPPPVTLSFRCRGESYDESGFAGIVARHFGTEHHLAEYEPERVREMPAMAAGMDEPFADIGINLATWILAGEAAAAGVETVLTGDGGDELFCGHPVYAADRLARRLGWVPPALLALAARPFTALSDSEAKKDLRVKLKRYAEGLRHPADLGPTRWRLHSSAAEAEALLAPGAPPALTGDPLAGVRAALESAAGAPDAESRAVLADYGIVVEFYLRRLVLARRHGIEARSPWLDRRLVELAATLPGDWRVEGLKDEKVLMKRVIAPWLPHEVVYRRDKLGHSVPFKNWLRESAPVRAVVDAALSPSAVSRRGLLRPEAVARLRAEHDSGRQNRSHRIWALAVLEAWMAGNLD